MDNKKHIVYLGSLGFPYGLAEVQKIILISKCLILTGNDVTVICRKGSHQPSDHPELKATGTFQGIEYVYSSGTPFYPTGFVNRNWLKVKGKFNEFLLLRRRKKEKHLDVAILSTHDFNAVFYYFLISKLIGFKIVLNYVEFYSGVKKKRSEVRARLNDQLFDSYAPALSDGILPISEFIIDHLKATVPGKKYLKIPGLTDFDRYNGIEASAGEKYFLFCGDAGYKETIFFSIDSFVALQQSAGNTCFLYLVINGHSHQVQEVKNYIENNPVKDRIRFFSKLPEKQLFTLYKNAMALLIPLRPNFQDIARFPHKTGEYLASGNPVISTNLGELKYYFKDMENMLLAEEYDIKKYSDKMQFVIDQPDISKEIGVKGKSVASSIFDYRNRAKYVNDFFNILLGKQ